MTMPNSTLIVKVDDLDKQNSVLEMEYVVTKEERTRWKAEPKHSIVTSTCRCSRQPTISFLYRLYHTTTRPHDHTTTQPHIRTLGNAPQHTMSSFATSFA